MKLKNLIPIATCFWLCIGLSLCAYGEERNISTIQDFYPNKALKSENSYQGRLLHGVSKTYAQDGVITGIWHYNKGKKDGTVVRYYPSGTLRSEQNYVKGQLDGINTLYRKDGSLQFQWNYIRGLKAGDQKSFYKNGQLHVLSNNSQRSAKGPGSESTYYDSGEIKNKATFDNGIIVDNGIKYHKSGSESGVYPYENGVLEGHAKEYDTAGNHRATLSYHVGQLSGISTYFNESGQRVRTCAFSKGKKEGKESLYHPSGKIIKTQYYVADQLHGVATTYYSNGKKRSEEVFVLGQSHNQFFGVKKYDLAGNRTDREGIREFTDKQLNALYAQAAKEGESFNGKKLISTPDGKPYMEITFKAGKIAGEFLRFNQNGKPIAQIKKKKPAKPYGVDEYPIAFKPITSFGTIKAGEKPLIEIKGKNTTKSVITIKSIKASCGCTEPKFSKDPIAPGAMTNIKASYNSRGRHGHQDLTITIFLVGHKRPIQLHLEGEVKGKPPRQHKKHEPYTGKLKPQATCPFVGSPIKKSYYADVLGKRIYTCCEGCISLVKETPQKALDTLRDKYHEGVIAVTKVQIQNRKAN